MTLLEAIYKIDDCEVLITEMDGTQIPLCGNEDEEVLSIRPIDSENISVIINR